ncbi:MAG TPA: hypothetical protein VFP91_08930 [Vicinamibacterales bacterium]|nr:hypothetical protein [Vicinamibacterales bacterium]
MTRSKFSLMKKTVLAVALVAATAGVASADDGGMGRFSDSYQYFASQPVNKSPSEWRAENPNGISEQQLEAYSDPMGTAFLTTKPVFDKSPSQFRLANPHGLSEREYQALSSEGPAWHSSPAGGALASSDQTAVAQGASKDTLAARVAQFFHPTKSDVQAQ